MKRFSILGSTGSIGTQTLEILRADPGTKVTALAVLKNIDRLEEQITEFDPEIVCVYDGNKAEELKKRLSSKTGHVPEVVSGMEGLIRCASLKNCDTVVVSVVGMIGIRPTIAAIKAGKNIALANKETLVTAGHIIMPMVKAYGVKLMPVDSEHSAIYQCLVGEDHDGIDELLLTASGGPFRGYTKEQIKSVKACDALKHPNWDMGAKITIDCATMVNKALEVMEAHWLFDVPVDRIRVVVQPKSIIHSMVQFIDGAVKAQLGVPSMLIPIEYALYEEKRHRLPAEEKLDFTTLTSIEFCVPDMEVFKGLKLGIEAGKKGGTMPTVFNAANEELVAAFLSGKIGFTDIADGIESAMTAHEWSASPDLETIFAVEEWARDHVREEYGLTC